jgi:hypothetical protein
MTSSLRSPVTLTPIARSSPWPMWVIVEVRSTWSCWPSLDHSPWRYPAAGRNRQRDQRSSTDSVRASLRALFARSFGDQQRHPMQNRGGRRTARSSGRSAVGRHRNSSRGRPHARCTPAGRLRLCRSGPGGGRQLYTPSPLRGALAPSPNLRFSDTAASVIAFVLPSPRVARPHWRRGDRRGHRGELRRGRGADHAPRPAPSWRASR